MNTRSDILGVWLLVCALGAATSGLSAPPLDSLRVSAIQPSAFDYLLTGLSRSVDGRAQLSFNDRLGNTWFVAPGEMLGAYRVESFATRTNRAYNASLRSWQESRVVSVVLGTPSGPSLTLVQGERLPRPGWTARLVALDTGAGWTVREGDTFTIAGHALCAASITETTIAVRAASPTIGAKPQEVSIPDLTAAEREALSQRLALAAQQRQAALAAAQPDETNDEDEPFPPVVESVPPRRQTSPSWEEPSPVANGGVYSYPTDFEQIPTVWGSPVYLVPDRYVIPRRSERHHPGPGRTAPPRPASPPSATSVTPQPPGFGGRGPEIPRTDDPDHRRPVPPGAWP